MPTPTYTPLANKTLTTTETSIIFSSIPQTYRDLVLIVNAIGSTNSTVKFRLNGLSTTIYTYVRISGDGTTATAFLTSISQAAGNISDVAQVTTSGVLQARVDILDYTQTNKHKTSIVRANQPENGTEVLCNRCAITAAVTSINIFPNTGQFAIGSTFALYGITG